MISFLLSLKNLIPQFRNYGVINEVDDKLLGATHEWKELQHTGQWTKTPWYEYQNIGFEKMACVTYSLFNCCEMVGIQKGYGQFDFSDRFTATKSGTTTRGNTLSNVFNSVIEDGALSEIFWRNETDNTSWSSWYKTPSQAVSELAKKNKKELSFYRRRVIAPTSTNMMKALKYSPLWASLYAYGSKVNGIYQRSENTINHVITVIGYKEGEYWIIFDHYKGNEIRKVSWDYKFGAVYNVDFEWLSKEKELDT